MKMYLSEKTNRLIGMRTYWMGQNGKDMTYEGSQNSLVKKMHVWKTGIGTLEVAGPHALLYETAGGKTELAQRNSESTHAGGSPEVQKLIIARRIGLSRTKEKAHVSYVGVNKES